MDTFHNSSPKFSPREEEIIAETLTRAMNILPEVIGNLMIQKSTTGKLSMKFFEENKSFLKHTDIVASTLEDVQNDNPGLQMGEWLELAKPIISKRIDIVDKSDFEKPEYPKSTIYNGVI